MKNVVVDGCSFSLSKGTGSITITTLPSSKLKAANKNVYCGTMGIFVSGFTGGTTVATGGNGTGEIKGSSKKTTYSKQPLLLEGDFAKVLISGSDSKGNPATETITVKIKDAGQSKVKTI